MNERVHYSGHPPLTINIIKKEYKYFFKLEQRSMIDHDSKIWKLPVFIKICRLIPAKEYEIFFEELNLHYTEIEKGNSFIVLNNLIKSDLLKTIHMTHSGSVKTFNPLYHLIQFSKVILRVTSYTSKAPTSLRL